MNQPLPTGGFKWVTPDEIGKLDNKGCLLEVDVKCPEELHESHNELLFMCEKMEINKVEKQKEIRHSHKSANPSSRTWVHS